MRSPSGFVFVLIACLVFNCLHCGLAAIGAAAANAVADDGGSARDDTTSGDGTVAGPLRIDITRKHSVHLNGVEIDEDSLADHLHDHERELIFGKTKIRRPIKLVHLRYRTDADDADVHVDVAVAATIATATVGATATVTAAPTAARRVKRADSAATAAERQSGAQPSQEVVSVQIRDNEQLLNLQLRQTPKLIDDAFVFIRRYANSTQFIEDSHKLAAKYERCFYSNENSALDLCDDENVRGVFHHNSTDYIIHPLPARFGNSTHVILQSGSEHVIGSPAATAATTLLDSNIQFEPDEEDFADLNVMNLVPSDMADASRPTRNTNDSSNYAPQNVADNISLTQQQQQQPRYHHNAYSKTQQIPLNLRYKPRYHHGDHHQQGKQQHHHNHHHHHHHHRQPKQHRSRQHEQRPHAHHPHTQAAQRTHEPHLQQNNAHRNRQRRHIASGGQWPSWPQVLHIETAIFVDSELFKHMAKNFPTSTESHLIRFVLAMINGVQLLYHHPSLGHRINFVLKRLEILYKEPKDLRRSSDIDTYLSNFCVWQKSLNPTSDADPMHYDHAVILTGLDLYVVAKTGKVINQVVGLAPVAGMCTLTSSCTINEGKHFESVFVVAHEIGHNLGMRHDTHESSCDPNSYIMSPTLGSGKTTWSRCSRDFLRAFLEKPQAECLRDRGQFINNLDHSAEGRLPGERFDANQQCMLKYGRESVRATNQAKSDMCHDLHCQRGRYTWTSHPALEGTRCGENMWCRSGKCVNRPTEADSYSAPKQSVQSAVGKVGYEKASFLESSKMGHLHENNYNKSPTWGQWGKASDCASGCLYGPSKRLREGSTGLRVYTRRCLDEQRHCLGRDQKFESCIAQQCYSVPITTIDEFAREKCGKMQKFDAELTGEGAQIVGGIEDSCKVFCRTKANGTKSRRHTFPDGTTCRSKHYKPDDTAYCIGGRCEKFSCDNSTQNYYKIDQVFCQQRQPTAAYNEVDNRRVSSYSDNSIPASSPHSERAADRGRDVTKSSANNFGIYAPTTYRSKYENEVAVRSFHGQEREQPYRRKTDSYPSWNKYNYPLNEERAAVPHAPTAPPPQQPPVSASLVAAEPESEWIVKSGCHSSCMAQSKGVQVVSSRRTGASNIQLCTHTVKPCERLLSPTEHAEHTCARYKLKVRGLSGHGTQIAASVNEPDRSCRVGCQDEFITYRYYLVNGKYGHFPLGTKCSSTEERYCVNGKCLEFGADNIPLQQSHISLALFRNRRSLSANATAVAVEPLSGSRQKRSYLYYNPVNITETITQDFIDGIVRSLMGYNEQRDGADELPMDEHIEFTNPIHISADDEMNSTYSRN